MKITKLFTVEETVDLLRRVSLRGNKSALPYKNARIRLQKLSVIYLTPCQYHVYPYALARVASIKRNPYTAEIFDNAKVGSVEMENDDGVRFIHMPPIVEQINDNYNDLLVIADGTHRLYYSIIRGYKYEYCWLIENVNPRYPYYAKPIRGGWASINIYDQLPDNFIKRDYVKNHKKLYRNYNGVFTNIQPER